jgi:trehalose 6-phosphate phosphatase
MTPPVPARPALFLDFDGCLVELAPTPDSIRVAPELPALIGRLVERTQGATAVVSGRTVADIDRWLAVPVAAAGTHGLEHRAAPGGAVVPQPIPPEIEVLRRRIRAFPFLRDGVRLEDKGAGLVLHYRAAPEMEAAVKAAMAEATADLPALHLVNGKMVVEAKAAGIDKGTALAAFMAEPPFRGRTPVFVGDDVTDEDGFRAAAAHGGFGVKVGAGDSAARFRLPDVAAVHAFLRTLAAA